MRQESILSKSSDSELDELSNLSDLKTGTFIRTYFRGCWEGMMRSCREVQSAEHSDWHATGRKESELQVSSFVNCLLDALHSLLLWCLSCSYWFVRGIYLL